jgi:hypothetical protein
MFRWYRDAARCFVYLSDVSAASGLSQDGDKSKPSWKEAFEKSRWFTRGWTLQEILTPESVQFFSKEGVLLGDKESLEPQIHKEQQRSRSGGSAKPWTETFRLPQVFPKIEAANTTIES